MALGLFSKSYNRCENNIVQTAGTTTGQIAFLCWLLAVFDILAAEPGSGFDVHLTRMQTFVWLSAAGLLGVLLAVPLRKHFIEDENPYRWGRWHLRSCIRCSATRMVSLARTRSC